MSERLAMIRARLERALAPSALELLDESQLHAGHAGAAGGAGHYAVTITASAFAGKPALERHRLVYAAVADLMPHEIHALRITARAPGE